MKKISSQFKNILGLLVSLLVISHRADAQIYTLSQILDSITLNNPGLQQFSLKTNANFADADAAKAWMAPTAGVGLSEFPYGGGGSSSNTMMARKMVMLRLEQMFPNFSQQNKEKDYYHSLSRQNKDDSATMRNLLFAKAKMAYYDAYIAEKKLAVIDQQEKQMNLLIKITEGRLPYGKASLPDIYKARAKLSDLGSMRVQLQSMSAEATAILNSLMDHPQDEAFSIDTTTVIDPSDLADLAVLQIDSTYILTKRSDITRSSDEIHSLTLSKAVINAQSKPSFGLGLDNMRMNAGGYMYSAMITMSIPIAPWFSKSYRSKSKATDYQIQSMHKMQDSQVLEAIGNIQKDFLKLQAAEKEVQIFKGEVMPAYARTYQSYLNAFSENTGDIYETLMAWEELTMKKMQYWDKISDLLNIRVMLEAEMQKD